MVDLYRLPNWTFAGWRRGRVLGVLAAAAVLTAGSWCYTQLMAHVWRYDPALGEPAMRTERGAGIYRPFTWVSWLSRIEGRPERESEAVTGLLLVGTVSAGAAVWAGLAAAGDMEKVGDIQGSARMMREDELAESGFAGDEGVELGKLGSTIIRVPPGLNTIGIGPPNSGKTTGMVMRTLQSWPHSAVVFDFKGELFRDSAGWRGFGLDNGPGLDRGQHVLRFSANPRTGGYVGINNLIWIPRGDEEVGSTGVLVESLMSRGDDQQEHVFFGPAAAAFLQGLLLHVLYGEQSKTFARAAEIVSGDHEYLERIAGATYRVGGRVGVAVKAINEPIGSTMRLPAETRGGIIGNARKVLALYVDPLVARGTSTNGFHPRDLRGARAAGDRHDRPVTLYIDIPPTDGQVVAPHMRMVLTQMIRELCRVEVESDVRRVLIFLDEFANFGKLKIIEQALSFARGYRVDFLLAVQGLNQLEHVYGRNQQVMLNSSAQMSFAPNDNVTAEYLSKSVGMTTVTRERGNMSVGRGGVSRSVSADAVGRRLLMAEEIRRMPIEREVVLVKGHYPIFAQWDPWFRDPIAVRKVALDPPPQSAVLPQTNDWTDCAIDKLGEPFEREGESKGSGRTVHLRTSRESAEEEHRRMMAEHAAGLEEGLWS